MKRRVPGDIGELEFFPDDSIRLLTDRGGSGSDEGLLQRHSDSLGVGWEGLFRYRGLWICHVFALFGIVLLIVLFDERERTRTVND